MVFDNNDRDGGDDGGTPKGTELVLARNIHRAVDIPAHRSHDRSVYCSDCSNLCHCYHSWGWLEPVL